MGEGIVPTPDFAPSFCSCRRVLLNRESGTEFEGRRTTHSGVVLGPGEAPRWRYRRRVKTSMAFLLRTPQEPIGVSRLHPGISLSPAGTPFSPSPSILQPLPL